MSVLKDHEKCKSPWMYWAIIFVIATISVIGVFEVESNQITFNRKHETVRSRAVVHSRGNILVASSGRGLKYQVSQQFETSQKLIVVDPKTKMYRIFNNNIDVANNTGLNTFVETNKVGAVVVGTMNYDTYQKFNNAEVDIYSGVSGDGNNAVKMLINHELKLANPPKQTKTTSATGNKVL